MSRIRTRSGVLGIGLALAVATVALATSLIDERILTAVLQLKDKGVSDEVVVEKLEEVLTEPVRISPDWMTRLRGAGVADAVIARLSHRDFSDLQETGLRGPIPGIDGPDGPDASCGNEYVMRWIEQESAKLPVQNYWCDSEFRAHTLEFVARQLDAWPTFLADEYVGLRDYEIGRAGDSMMSEDTARQLFAWPRSGCPQHVSYTRPADLSAGLEPPSLDGAWLDLNTIYGVPQRLNEWTDQDLRRALDSRACPDDRTGRFGAGGPTILCLADGKAISFQDPPMFPRTSVDGGRVRGFGSYVATERLLFFSDLHLASGFTSAHLPRGIAVTSIREFPGATAIEFDGNAVLARLKRPHECR